MVRVSGRIPSPVHDPQEEAETIEPMVPEIPSAMNSTSMRFEFYRLPTSICHWYNLFNVWQYVGVGQGNTGREQTKSSPRKLVQLKGNMTVNPQGIHKTYMVLLL